MRGVCFRPDGRSLASVGADQAALLWDWAEEKTVLRYSKEGFEPWGVGFPREGGLVVLGRSGDYWATWDATHGEKVLTERRREIHSLCFSPEGKTLALASDSETAHVTLREVNPAQNHPRVGQYQDGAGKPILSVALSPEGKRAASAGEDGVVYVRDLEQGKPLHRLEAHHGAVYSICFSRDGRALASAGEDGTVILWDPVVVQANDVYQGGGRLVEEIERANGALQHAQGRLQPANQGVEVRRIEGRRRHAALAPEGAGGEGAAIQSLEAGHLVAGVGLTAQSPTEQCGW